MKALISANYLASITLSCFIFIMLFFFTGVYLFGVVAVILIGSILYFTIEAHVREIITESIKNEE